MARIRDSRRLPGPNLLSPKPGAVLDVTGPADEIAALIPVWQDRARAALDAVGWGACETASRVFRGGASLFLSAPVDGLYAATYVNEWAYDAAVEATGGPTARGLDRAAKRLRRDIEREANPALMALRAAASERGVLFFQDPDRVSVGTGRGSLTFDVDHVPRPEKINWAEVYDVPVALVTGTNGKSTTVRVVASMAKAAGLVPGLSSTDGVVVGDLAHRRGDYSGPEGARAVLRDERVEVAVLETARGGMLRRGLALPRADVAAVLNVAEDHLGEFGIDTLADLVHVKLVIRRAVATSGALVLNLDDDALAAWQQESGAKVDAFSRHARPKSETAAWVEDNTLMLARGGNVDAIAAVDEIPLTMGGTAAYNVENALAAVMIGARLGLDVPHLRQGLCDFESDPEHNPGRANLFEFGGAKVLVDYAHNPHGVRALLETTTRMEAKRTLVLLGQAGDRSDAAIRELADIAWEYRPDRIVVKEMVRLHRGRGPDEIPNLIEGRLRELGATEDHVARADSELEAVEMALAWAKPGDLLLLLVHDDRTAVIDRLQA